MREGDHGFPRHGAVTIITSVCGCKVGGGFASGAHIVVAGEAGGTCNARVIEAGGFEGRRVVTITAKI